MRSPLGKESICAANGRRYYAHRYPTLREQRFHIPEDPDVALQAFGVTLRWLVHSLPTYPAGRVSASSSKMAIQTPDATGGQHVLTNHEQCRDVSNVLPGKRNGVIRTILKCLAYVVYSSRAERQPSCGGGLPGAIFGREL